MRVTAFDEYGLRCLIYIASQRGAVPTSASGLARAEGLSQPYANKLLHQLKQLGWIEAVRGVKGGYRLTHGTEGVSLAQIMGGWGGCLYDGHHCSAYAGNRPQCPRRKRACGLRAVWQVLSDQAAGVLAQTTLGDLVGHDEQTLVQRLTERSWTYARRARRGVGAARRGSRRRPFIKEA